MSPWPAGFQRLPNDDWTHQPIETLARKYDTVENHGWYTNLDPTVTELSAYLQDGHVLVDYSGGTGILVDRLLQAMPRREIGIVIVDASPKFLRLALEKFRDEPRVGLRLIRYLKEERRLQLVDEVLDVACDALASTNAIHLYYDLEETLRSWRRILKPGARAFIQSGNIRNPRARPGEWIIDETVEALHEAATRLVRSNERYAAYRSALIEEGGMAAHAALRRRYFLPVRPLDYYLEALRGAGFTILRVAEATIEARVDEWYQFLAVYHEGVLGWVGGVEKVEGRPASEPAIADRLALMRDAMGEIFGGRASFPCCWTYVTCYK
jgi:ubiquinone/menaquinone biosynthesis C-methylase UbiE